MNSHPFLCTRGAERHPHTYKQPDRAPRSGRGRRSHKRKQENVSTEGATNRKGESQPRVSGANTSEINTKDSPTAEPTPLNGGRGDAHQERREGARVSSANRGAQPQRSEDAGGGRKGEKLTYPATAGQKQPRRGKPLCRGRSARGRADRADRREGSPPDRPKERQRGRERAKAAPQGRTTRAPHERELATEGGKRANQTDTHQVPGRANSREHEGRKQETQTKSAPSRGARDPRQLRPHREADRRSQEQQGNHSRRRTRRRSGGGVRAPAREPRLWGGREGAAIMGTRPPKRGNSDRTSAAVGGARERGA